MLEDIVTAPVVVIAPASARPFTIAPAAKVIVVFASMLPSTTQPPAIVAEEPTCQKTLEACAPFSRTTLQRSGQSERGGRHLENPDRIGVALGVESQNPSA